MERLISTEEVRGALARPRMEGRTVGFVPTMGALHEGHLSLVRASLRQAEITVVSVFVNPTQFGPDEDFDAYPRDLEADAALLEAEGVDMLFMPKVSAMYPSGASTTVDPGPMASILCGAARPGHFVGVATVVAKFLGIVDPDLAFFGEKDYQQLKVVERVVRDLDIRARVVGCPIVRESDGVAMSSRNRYLTPEDRRHATVLYRALAAVREAALAGRSDVAALEHDMAAVIGSEEGVSLEYAVVVDSSTLGGITTLDRPARAMVAARVGSARLIDNVRVSLPGTRESA